MSTDDERGQPAAGVEQFATTHWSIVLAAGDRASPDSSEALASLCQTYWYPLYAYVRRRVGDVHQAQDLTQAFFARLLERNDLAVVDPERGRFRAFLLTALKHFLINQWERDRAIKRGGDRKKLPFDFDSGESRYSLEPADNLTPQLLYERQWALSLLEQVVSKLRDDFVAAGKTQQFDELKGFITARNRPESYSEAAGNLGISENAAKVAAHRLRRRYRELLRAEIARTVADPKEIDDEIRSLFTILGS